MEQCVRYGLDPFTMQGGVGSRGAVERKSSGVQIGVSMHSFCLQQRHHVVLGDAVSPMVSWKLQEMRSLQKRAHYAQFSKRRFNAIEARFPDIHIQFWSVPNNELPRMPLQQCPKLHLPSSQLAYVMEHCHVVVLCVDPESSSSLQSAEEWLHVVSKGHPRPVFLLASQPNPRLTELKYTHPLVTDVLSMELGKGIQGSFIPILNAALHTVLASFPYRSSAPPSRSKDPREQQEQCDGTGLVLLEAISGL